MSDLTVAPAANKTLRNSRLVFVACAAAPLLLIAWAAVTLGHSGPSEEKLGVIAPPLQSVAEPSITTGSGTSVPSASEVFQGRDLPPEEMAPTF